MTSTSSSRPTRRRAPQRYDVLGLGCTAVDDLLFVATFPAEDSKMRVLRRVRQCGGLCATALVAAARLGARCAYAGTLGHDPDSAFVRDVFTRERIDTRPTVFHPQARPVRSVIIVRPTSGSRTILADVSHAMGAHPRSPSASVIRAARVLLVDHFGMPGMIRAARIARRAAIPVVADFDAPNFPRLPDLIALVDHLIISRAFARTATQTSNLATAARRLWHPRRAVVVITDGAKGCWYLDRPDGDLHHLPAFPVNAVDTTGCGDVFHGAYAAALAQGLPIENRLRLAAAAAALKATRPGGQDGIPRRTELRLAGQAPHLRARVIQSSHSQPVRMCRVAP